MGTQASDPRGRDAGGLGRRPELAGTLLTVCLLPGLRRKITQHGWGLDREEAESIAVAALWRRIWTYPLLRRPRRIAMNLLMDTTHDLIDAASESSNGPRHDEALPPDVRHRQRIKPDARCGGT
jgi:hypothetical protein